MRKINCIRCSAHLLIIVPIFGVCLGAGISQVRAQENKVDKPIVVNGDTVEYATDKKVVTAKGHVSVVFKGATLTCDTLSVNTETKDAEAAGHARLEDSKGIISADKILYNFQTKTGTMFDTNLRASPYFIMADKVQRMNEEEFIGYNTSMTTCDYDVPHFRIRSKKIDMIPQKKVNASGNTVLVGNYPVMFLPDISRKLNDKKMHFIFTPGSRKDWGMFLLTGYRFNLNDSLNGRLYLDYRSKLGLAEGFGLNSNTKRFGKLDFKLYYSHEKPNNLPEGTPANFERYLIRLRHKWDIDPQTNLTTEYYRIVDSKRMVLGTNYNILKDYFFREYEVDSLPLSYSLFHHSFQRASVDVMVQPRSNRWYTQLEKLPEINYSYPNGRIGETPIYFENQSQYANYDYKHAVPSPSTDDIVMQRLDTTNKFSIPMKAAFVSLTPFVGNRETFYDKDKDGASIAPRTIFLTGSDVTTKFFRVFNVKSNFLKMEVNGLRHVITPKVTYSYSHEPSITSSHLKQIDAVDALTRNHSMLVELSNKLQTKRKNMTVDLAEFRINSTYTIDEKAGQPAEKGFSDFLLNLDFIPYSWMRLQSQADYDPVKRSFNTVNYDFNFSAGNFGAGIGQRYARNGGNEITFSSDWRLNPKWKFRLYERYQAKETSAVRQGLKEQEYSFERDLHCWILDFTYNITKEQGHSLWLILKLKAFPELGFTLDQSYHRPKPGSQSNP